jgi:DNA-binding MarR family transcriptional regulator/predicted N-acetyltransferase YhbS
MPPSPPADRIDTVRRFNRFYTRRLGLLRKGFLDSRFSLGELRVLYEISARDRPTATDLVRDLDLDPGYLSRLLGRFESQDLVTRTPSATDARQRHLALTPLGRKTFAPFERRSQQDAAAMLAALSETDQHRLTAAMQTIEQILAPPARPAAPFVLRPPGPGDLGWVVARHGVLYAQERGWGPRFEGLVAEIVAAYVANLKPDREACWIAERDGEPVGSVFLVEGSEQVAKLRLLLVEPSARGLGIGRALVAQCITFARDAGYSSITLWTQSILTDAHVVYRNAGFRRVARKAHQTFGVKLTGETWDLTL